MSDNIKVVVKVRPLIPREIEDKLYRQWRVVNNTIHQIDQNGKDVLNGFTFDKVYDEYTKTTDVYDDIAKPIVEAAAAGFNGTIFAYGQTSSGKTYTMTGTDEAPGIIPLSVMNLFDIIKNISDRDFLVRVSYVEIYNETLIDLLNTEKKNIKIQDTLQGVKVDATVRVATSPEEVLQFMKEGQANRQTGSTNMNVESSRSHTIFQITVESREQTEGEEVGCLNVSQLNLVDLAGSERSGQTGATGMRFKEGTHINKSLTFLGLVIKQLSEGQSKHVNYRDSKLTRILQNSLGGNAKTSIICAVTPAAVEETISTLQFASRAKAIKNSPEVNVVATDNKMIDSLTKQLSSLKTQLESKRNVEEDNQKLQKQISVLQRFLSGFGQRSTADMLTGAKRKIQQIRRATISTPHIQVEDTTPSVPRFCTPSLKYNPALIGNSTEFLPIHSMTNLASVPEESPRLITPPPRDQRTTINEVIEIDSDDDMPSNTHTCSPHHKCFNASKTPPCVLRKAAMEADKNFKDLLELTEREKIYSPNVLELLEKLEQSKSVISTLERNIGTLNKLSIENESEIKNLKEKINKTEEEVRSVTSVKLQLEARCTEYDTKLTDVEIMYETLKKKAKIREGELLSRLEEVGNVKKSNDAKDIIGTTGNSAFPNIEELVKDLKQQLSERNKFIAELEENLHTQNEKVVSLERQTQEIQAELETCKEHLCKSEDENILHKTTIKTMNTIIENQKSNLNIATNDLQAYNNTIQQLQDQLSKKEKLFKISLNDDEIENLIINEEKIIANNENINNIIQYLKIALQSKNKEIQTLKWSQNKETESELCNKQIEITQLQEKVTALEKQLEQNNLDLTNLLQEKSSLLTSLEEVNKKLLELQENNKELCNDIKNYESKLSSLNEYNEELKNEKEHIEKELTGMNMELTSQIENYLNKINHLENDLQTKNAQIETLDKNTDQSKYVNKFKEIITKLHGTVFLITGENKTFSHLNGASLDSLESIDDKFKELENIVMEVVSDIKTFKTNILRNVGREIILEITSLDDKFNILENAVSSCFNDETKFSDLYEALPKEHEEVFKKSCLENVDDLLKKIVTDNFSKVESKSLLNLTNSVCSNMKHKIEYIKSLYVTSVELVIKKLETKDSELSQLNKEVDNLKTNLENKSQEHLCTLEEHNIYMIERNEIINNIFRKIVEMGHTLHIGNDVMVDFSNICDINIYTSNQILPILDKMASQYSLKVEQLEECSKQKAILIEAQNKIHCLTGEDIDLVEYVTKVSKSNSDISTELYDIRKDNENLMDDLKSSNEVLKNLKEELKGKLEELDVMEGQVLKWKKQFNEHDLIMKKQLNDLRKENTELRKKCLQYNSLQSEDVNDADSNDRTNIQTVHKIFASDTPNTPPSLLTISCNKIVEIIQDIENTASSVTPSISKSDMDIENFESSNSCCECDKLKDELKILSHKNLNLTKHQDVLELTNKNLMKEIHDAYEEIKELLSCAKDLQKKIFNHRTNLSTLTATTYAENKSLSSQNKFLQLHHTRFHTVCQRDLPELKEQLRELMTLLKEENLESKLNASFKRYSLPVTLDSNSILYSFKNESTLGSDILMLDTNVTVNTTADNTLTGLDQTCCEVAQGYSYNDVACQTTSCPINEPSHDLYNDQNIMNRLQMVLKENEDLHKLLKIVQGSKTDVVKVNAETSPVKYISTIESPGKALCEICEKENETNAQLQREIANLKEKLLEISIQKDELEEKYNDLSLEVLVCKMCQEETERRIKLSQEVEKLKENLLQVTNQKDDLEKKYSNPSLETLVCNTCENEKEQRINLAQEVEKLKESLVQVTNQKDDFEKKYSDLSLEILVCNTCENEKEQRINLAQEVEKLKESLVQVTNQKDDFEKKYSDLSIEILICNTCENEKEQRVKLAQEVEKLKENLHHVTYEKVDLEKKYNDLSLEVPSTEALLRKLHNFEKELENKSKEIEKLLTALKSTKDQLNGVQEENDNLSTQVMEFLSEIDDLKKDLETEKSRNCQNIPVSNSVSADSGVANINEDKYAKVCLECIQKDEHIKTLESKNSNTHTRLSRSYSDSDSSSRYNKICTLQNELDAGREDCNELKEEVTTIKNQLESNNLSISEAMDLDESISDTNTVDSAPNKSVMPKITEENVSDIYNHDKLDCLNYYMEKLGEKVNFDKDIKIIDVMKTFYSKLMTGHENQIEIMLNKLRDYEHTKCETDEKIVSVSKSLEENNCNVKNIETKLSVLRNNIDIFGEKKFGNETMKLFKENVLMVLDTEFAMNSKSIFETVLEQSISVNSNELNELSNKYIQLEECSHKLKQESESLNNEVIQLKSQLADKENEFNLLAAQKDRIHEINNALTMDLIKKEEEFVETVCESYRKLVENNILITEDIDTTLPPGKKLQLIVNLLMAQNNSQILSEKDKEINVLKQDVVNYQTILEEKTKELSVVTDLFETTKELNNEELKNKQDEIQTQKSLYDDLNKIYNTKVEENNVNRTLIQKLTEEINILKESITTKDTLIDNLQDELAKYRQSCVESESKMPELLQQISNTRQELDDLKLINQTLTQEKDAMTVEYEKLRKGIEQNKIDHNKMESDILILKESVKENDNVVDGLKREIAALMLQNSQLKEEIEEKGKELSRLQFNIKTHETTARIQTKMISRLQKQKEDDGIVINEKDKQLAELNQKCEMHQKESTQMSDSIVSLKQEVELLKHLKQSLEEKVSHLESSQESARRSRSSIESVTDSSRRRRQSIHDSTRMIDDNVEDHNKAESVPNGRPKADELMDVDEDSSYRNTPVRLSKGRDRLPSKNEESEEDGGSRCNSAMAARRRRRSIHDLQRPNLVTPDGHDLSHGKLRDEPKHSSQSDTNVNSSVIELQSRLSACQQELEELRESYKELDEECETCAEYLRERDDQCARLKKDKASLEKIITDLNEKLQNNHGRNSTTATYADAAVNTDEDWTNLHSIVVDRMSFDAEVEKNKRLRRAIEELRFNKQELKITVAKMQRALDEKTSKDKDTKELERTRIELDSCREELEDLKRRYQELDEECETCAQYLRERDEQCRRLKETLSESEKIITDLNEKLQNNHSQSTTKAVCTNTAVNTDEVTVDRMSFDAEVEKNKRLTGAIEELRLNNKELKITVAKMQKVLEEKTSKDTKELERARMELLSCRKELEDLKRRYQELDEECETCAQYLRERDEQCRRLKETVATLEAKVQELQENAGHVSLSARKKRQSLHDLNRPVAEGVDASTEITEDFSSRQVPVTDDTQTKLIKKLKAAVEKLNEQKTNLEQQLMAASTAPVYVATGSAIVQNQQITDVMKENQKLKKMNAELIVLCKKRGKAMVKSNRENQDPIEEI